MLMGRPAKEDEPRSVTTSFRVTESMSQRLDPYRDARALSDLLNGLLRAYLAEAEEDGEVDSEALERAVKWLRVAEQESEQG